MTDTPEPVRIYVYYTASAGTWFDQTYYVQRHLPIVMGAWARYGLISARAFFPAESEDGTLAICECLFRDEDAVEASYSSQEASEVMADVARFTAISPRQLRALPLRRS